MGKVVVRTDNLNLEQAQRKVSGIAKRIHAEGLHTDCVEVVHHFAHGQYAREARIPAGVVVVGKRHLHSHVNILSAGSCTVYTAGEGESDIKAPCTFISNAGTQRVILAHTDVVWTTVHVTDKTDLEDIEREVIQEE